MHCNEYNIMNTKYLMSDSRMTLLIAIAASHNLANVDVYDNFQPTYSENEYISTLRFYYLNYGVHISGFSIQISERGGGKDPPPLWRGGEWRVMRTRQFDC